MPEGVPEPSLNDSTPTTRSLKRRGEAIKRCFISFMKVFRMCKKSKS